MKGNVDIHKVHYRNVVLTGGASMYGTHPCALTVTIGMVPEEDGVGTHGIKQNSNVVYVDLGECFWNTAGQ